VIFTKVVLGIDLRTSVSMAEGLVRLGCQIVEVDDSMLA
jgi:hypothetical protein